jgi:hypothetical protein
MELKCHVWSVVPATIRPSLKVMCTRTSSRVIRQTLPMLYISSYDESRASFLYSR